MVWETNCPWRPLTRLQRAQFLCSCTQPLRVRSQARGARRPCTSVAVIISEPQRLRQLCRFEVILVNRGDAWSRGRLSCRSWRWLHLQRHHMAHVVSGKGQGTDCDVITPCGNVWAGVGVTGAYPRLKVGDRSGVGVWTALFFSGDCNVQCSCSHCAQHTLRSGNKWKSMLNKSTRIRPGCARLYCTNRCMWGYPTRIYRKPTPRLLRRHARQ